DRAIQFPECQAIISGVSVEIGRFHFSVSFCRTVLFMTETSERSDRSRKTMFLVPGICFVISNYTARNVGTAIKIEEIARARRRIESTLLDLRVSYFTKREIPFAH